MLHKSTANTEAEKMKTQQQLDDDYRWEIIQIAIQKAQAEQKAQTEQKGAK
jgi:hypothetical protein